MIPGDTKDEDRRTDMSDTDSTRAKVIEHLIAASDEEIKPEDVTDSTKLRDDLDLSSLQAVTLVMDLEDEFGVVIEDEEIEKLATVGDVLETIRTKQVDAD
jgi:acyl carrier protein